MAEVLMPRLSDSMEEGTVLKWLKSLGDEVAVGDELVEIETDKANMVYEADSAGALVEILAVEGDTLPIGAVIARVGDRAEVSANGAAAVRIKASPIAKRIAREADLDLRALSGSGTGGRIVKSDVEAALASGSVSTATLSPPLPETGVIPAPKESAPSRAQAAAEQPETAKGEVEVVELTKLQQTVARRMAESKATAPHFYLQGEIDMTAAVQGRQQLKETRSERVPTFNDMVVKACALALREFPRANGAYRDGKIELYSRINVGVAVAAQDALVVPTVFDADSKGLQQIASDTWNLAARVRDGSITPPELSGGTFTVSNLGMYGISNFGAVINTPQAGILAVGELKAKPVVTDAGQIEARQMMGVTLACDHRILYGADGAQFLARVRELLESPLGLAL
jgi:pyruvate dehydrogenase E2 component (dihydrolipoamide acetyltransferase)